MAVDGDFVAGIAHIMSDGLIQAHLSAIAISSTHRGQGIGKLLLREGLDRAGGGRMDLISVADGFYSSITNRRFTGFRVTRSDLGLSRRR